MNPEEIKDWASQLDPRILGNVKLSHYYVEELGAYGTSNHNLYQTIVALANLVAEYSGVNYKGERTE